MNQEMENKTIEVSMQLISISGDAKARALKAMKLAKNGEFEKAKQLADDARNKLNEVHRVHAEIISEEAQGKKFDIKTLFIHAQDHFMGAIVVLDLVDHIIALYQMVERPR